jgi:hypothetical protein
VETVDGELLGVRGGLSEGREMRGGGRQHLDR